MASFNLDRSFFLIWITGTGWTDKPVTYTPQTELEDMPSSFNALADFMVGAFDVEDVTTVIEFNPAEGWSRDITADVIAAMKDDSDGDDNREHRIGAFEAGVGAFA